MATRAELTKKTTKKPASATKVAKTTKTIRPVKVVAPARSRAAAAHTGAPSLTFAQRFNRDITPQALVAEVIGTFILVTVAIGTISALSPLYVGLALLVLVATIGGISGAHVNPAVTFGLWTMRKLPGLAVPFFWIAQFIGALAALLAVQMFSGKVTGLNLSNFFAFNWSVFAIEVIGTGIFLFGVAAAVTRPNLSVLSRAATVGLSFFVALTVAIPLYTSLNNSIDKTKVSLTDIPRVLRLDGAMLNPAIAVAAKERTTTQLQGSTDDGSENTANRLTLGETIVGPLLGAAIGGNLYLLLARREREQA